MSRERVCDQCGRWIDEGETLYEMAVTLRAEAPDAMEISQEDLESRGTDEWEELMRQLERMTPNQVEEATDQVHESHQFALCPGCRQNIHRILRRHRVPFPPSQS